MNPDFFTNETTRREGGVSADPDSTQSEAVLANVMEEYLLQLEAGTAPDRNAIIQQYPQYAAELESCLQGIDFVHQLAPQDCMAPENLLPPSSNLNASATLGDFRIIRELGRGGMGVVYEAHQLSLDRQVALKILPLASLIDDRALIRFRNEVRAAATLEHPNIVSIYSVGEERGVHYYAMQLIRGQSLATLIHALREVSLTGEPIDGSSISRLVSDRNSHDESDPTARTPSPGSDRVGKSETRGRTSGDSAAETNRRGRSKTLPGKFDQAWFRNVARLVIQASEALAHAHEQGVIHRDIKPGNLLVDHGGKLFIADFGLARIETDVGVTMTGDMLGTLRYMSPEQVQSNRMRTDERTDIYSLGATLYELLSLQPLFGSDDRPELIRQICHGEPTALRKIRPSIPSDLETIVFKATRKNPEERYQTARQLADDLQRFLDNKPVIARRPSMIDRGRKWARRNQPIVVSAIVVLFLAVVGLTVSNMYILHERNVAQAEKDRAENNLDQALEAVDRLLTRIAENRLANTPLTEELRKGLYEDALEICQSIIESESSHPEARMRTAGAFHRVARIYQQMGQLEEAENAYRQAAGILRKWLHDFPGHSSELECRSRLAGTVHNLGNLIASSNPEEAEKLIREAVEMRDLALLEHQTNGNPFFLCEHAKALVALGNLRRLKGETDTRQLFDSAIAQLRDLGDAHPEDSEIQLNRAWAHGQLALMLRDSGQMAGAERENRLALEILEEWVPKATDQRWARLQLAETLRELGIPLQVSEPQESKRLLSRAVDVARELHEEFPETLTYEGEVAIVLTALGNTCEVLGEFDKATQYFDEAIRIRRSLSDRAPTDPEWRNSLADSLNDFANLLYDRGQSKEANAAMRESIALLEELASDSSDFPQHRQALASAYMNLANHLQRYGENEEAETELRKAIPVLQKLIADFPEQPDYQRSLAATYNGLGVSFIQSQQFDRGKAELPTGISIIDKLTSDFPGNADYVELARRLKANLAVCYAASGEYDYAEKVFLELVDFQVRLLEKQPYSTNLRGNCASTYANLGKIYKLTGRYELSADYYQRALDHHERLLADHPQNEQFKRLVADDLDNLGSVAFDQGQFDVAEGYWQEALDVCEEIGDPLTLIYARGKFAHLRWETEQYDEAAPLFEKQVADLTEHYGATHPKTLAILNDLALVLQLSGKLDVAADHFQAILAARSEMATANPEDDTNTTMLGAALCNLGIIYFEQEKFPESIEACKQAIDTLKTAIGGYDNRTGRFLCNAYRICGQSRKANQDFDLAIEDFGHARELTEDESQIASLRLWAGECHLALQQTEAAIESLTLAAEHEDFAGSANFHLARAFAAKGEAEPALAALQASVDSGYGTASAVEADPHLETLAGHEQLERILTELRSREAEPEASDGS